MKTTVISSDSPQKCHALAIAAELYDDWAAIRIPHYTPTPDILCLERVWLMCHRQYHSKQHAGSFSWKGNTPNFFRNIFSLQSIAKLGESVNMKLPPTDV